MCRRAAFAVRMSGPRLRNLREKRECVFVCVTEIKREKDSVRQAQIEIVYNV